MNETDWVRASRVRKGRLGLSMPTRASLSEKETWN